LSGARLAYAELQASNCGKTDFSSASLAHGNADEAYLGGAIFRDADLKGATLRGANLEEADMRSAKMDHADLGDANANGVRFTAASMVQVNLQHASLTRADLSGVDGRQMNLSGARLNNATLTGACLHGVVTTDVTVDGVVCEFIDISVDGDGSRPIRNAQIIPFLTGAMPAQAPMDGSAPGRRFFGKGDVLRNASLEFGEGASVEIESLFEACSIQLGKGTELVVGKNGVLAGCQILGAGNITIHGRFYEGQTPGIRGPNQLVVTKGASVVGAVEQATELTRFAFEPGANLRMKIGKPKGGGGGGGGGGAVVPTTEGNGNGGGGGATGGGNRRKR
jgi:uncharacterized protein YjbI with pentapeptide repeats